MIVLITNREYNKDTDKWEIMVSHGVNIDTDEIVPISQVPLYQLREAKFDKVLGKCVLYN